MWNAVVAGFRKYAVFGGRAARPAYWWFYLFIVLVNIPLYVLVDFAPRVGTALTWLWGAASFLPFLAAMARRLHDTDHSFWWGSAPALVLLPVLLVELLRPQWLTASRLAAHSCLPCCSASCCWGSAR